MEATPVEIDLASLEHDLKAMEGVKELHDLHVWSLSVGKSAMSAHIKSDNPFVTLKKATRMCHIKYKILHTTI